MKKFIAFCISIIGIFLIGGYIDKVVENNPERISALTDRLNVYNSSGMTIIILFGVLLLLSFLYITSRRNILRTSKLPKGFLILLSIIAAFVRITAILSTVYYKNIWVASSDRLSSIIEMIVLLLIIILPIFSGKGRSVSATEQSANF